jgi:PIN domain
MARRKMRRELRAVLDTNAIYTNVPSDLVKPEVSELINEHSRHADIQISWYLPEAVIHERHYQMIHRATDLLPALDKIERLLGHKLGITNDTLAAQVQQAVTKQLQVLTIKTASLDQSRVNWSNLLQDAAYRRPPFEAGEKEKGFRDALILESYCQLLEDSPRTPSICRVVLVTGDSRLTEAARDRTAAFPNASVLGSIEELRGLINTLVSEVDEDYIKTIARKAKSLFFEDAQHKDTVYYRDNIYQQIHQKYAQVLSEIPDGAENREHDQIFIGSPPTFVKKIGQTVYWATTITFTSKAYKTVSKAAAAPPEGALAGLYTGSTQPSPENTALGLITQAIAKYAPKEKQQVKIGKSVFLVNWHVNVGRHQKFGKPVVEKIEHTGTSWDDT